MELLKCPAPFALGALLTALLGAMTPGCKRHQEETEQLLADAVASYEALKPRLAQLQSIAASIQKDVKDLPGDTPGANEARAKLFTAEEVLGVLDAKMKWLSGEIEEARKSGAKEQVLSLKDAIASADQDLGQVDAVSTQLVHEAARLRQVAALLKAPYERELPTGFKVKAATNGIEAHLLDSIQADQPKADKKTWIDFDRLSFTGAGADLDLLASKSQLDNVFQILTAYPSVRLKIGGARAKAVKQALVHAGVDGNRLEAGGVGAASTGCPAGDPEACRARDRRVAVLVTRK